MSFKSRNFKKTLALMLSVASIGGGAKNAANAAQKRGENSSQSQSWIAKNPGMTALIGILGLGGLVGGGLFLKSQFTEKHEIIDTDPEIPQEMLEIVIGGVRPNLTQEAEFYFDDYYARMYNIQENGSFKMSKEEIDYLNSNAVQKDQGWIESKIDTNSNLKNLPRLKQEKLYFLETSKNKFKIANFPPVKVLIVGGSKTSADIFVDKIKNNSEISRWVVDDRKKVTSKKIKFKFGDLFVDSIKCGANGIDDYDIIRSTHNQEIVTNKLDKKEIESIDKNKDREEILAVCGGKGSAVDIYEWDVKKTACYRIFNNIVKLSNLYIKKVDKKDLNASELSQKMKNHEFNAVFFLIDTKEAGESAQDIYTQSIDNDEIKCLGKCILIDGNNYSSIGSGFLGDGGIIYFNTENNTACLKRFGHCSDIMDKNGKLI